MNIDNIVRELEACVAEAKEETGAGEDPMSFAELQLYLPVLERKIKERTIVQEIMGLSQEQFSVKEIAEILGLIKNQSIYTAILCLKKPVKAG